MAATFRCWISGRSKRHASLISAPLLQQHSSGTELAGPRRLARNLLRLRLARNLRSSRLAWRFGLRAALRPSPAPTSPAAGNLARNLRSSRLAWRFGLRAALRPPPQTWHDSCDGGACGKPVDNLGKTGGKVALTGAKGGGSERLSTVHAEVIHRLSTEKGAVIHRGGIDGWRAEW